MPQNICDITPFCMHTFNPTMFTTALMIVRYFRLPEVVQPQSSCHAKQYNDKFENGISALNLTVFEKIALNTTEILQTPNNADTDIKILYERLRNYFDSQIYCFHKFYFLSFFSSLRRIKQHATKYM